MEEKEIIELIKLYVGMYSDGSNAKVKPLLNILSDIESGANFDDIVESYNLV